MACSRARSDSRVSPKNLVRAGKVEPIAGGVRIELHGRFVLRDAPIGIARDEIVVAAQAIAIFGIAGIKPCGSRKALSDLTRFASQEAANCACGQADVRDCEHGGNGRNQPFASGVVERNLHVVRLETFHLRAARTTDEAFFSHRRLPRVPDESSSR